MITLAAALRMLHGTQQGVHLGEGERTVCPHAAMACHGGQKRLLRRLHPSTAALCLKIGEHVPQQLLSVGLRQKRRHFPHEQLPRSNAIDPQPERF